MGSEIMRGEGAMLDEILAYGRGDDNIRIITMNGSRVDPKAITDPWMDYDIVFHVRDLAPFIADPGWSRVFGDIIIAQTPFFMEGSRDEFPNFMSWYADGSRTDIRVRLLNQLESYLMEDSLTKVLLDKDDLVPDLPEATDAIHHLQKPTEAKFRDTVNEFYWVSLYLTKALARREYIAAVKYLEIVREELFRLLAWNIAHDRDYTVNFGNQWRFLTSFLSPSELAAVQATYELTDNEAVKRSLTHCRELFSKTQAEYGQKTGYRAKENIREILELERNRLESAEPKIT